MVNHQKMAVFDFAKCLRRFSAIDCSAFLCAFAALREANSFWQKGSRKGAKAQSCPDGPALIAHAFLPRNRFFDLLLCGVKTLSEHPLTALGFSSSVHPGLRSPFDRLRARSSPGYYITGFQPWRLW
jgi:hypothetical protein